MVEISAVMEITAKLQEPFYWLLLVVLLISVT